MSQILISTVTVGAGGASSISFSSIPQTYTDLLLVVSSRSTQAGQSYSDTLISFNGSASGYANRWIQGSGTAATSGTNTLGANILLNGSTAAANTFGSGQVYIPNYAGTLNKTAIFESTSEDNATLSFQRIGANSWSNTAAITSLTCTDSATYVASSTFSLYGIK